MPLTPSTSLGAFSSPIPKAARPVVKIIRRDVPRPKTLPVAMYQARRDYQSLRWANGKCPMGMHKLAKSKTPITFGSFPKCSEKEIFEFAIWWDRQSSAQEAVDAVWGRKRGKSKGAK